MASVTIKITKGVRVHAGHTEAHSSQSRRGLTWNKRSYRLLLRCLVDVDTGKQRVLETRAQKAAGQGLRASWQLV